NAIPRCSMSLCRCWETSNRLRLRRRLTVVRNSSPGSNILKTNLPSTPSAIRWPITTSLGYGQSSGLQTCAGDGARGVDQVGLQDRLPPTLLFVLLAVIGDGVARGAGIWAIALEMLVASTALQLGYVAGSAFALARRPMSAATVRLMRSMLE